MYRALYRKWRPQQFTDVYGQSHITDTLMHEVEANRLSHAYLFTGSRGTGKTTCAKILSKAVNCLNPQNGNPCNECTVCRGIDDGSILDVTEIDAASNNGVDNIRDLREEANFTPAAAKYRVYIIDEVHMLSTGAFNALLKTLEEPPEHVLFILATTEVQKLPATILSRCQRFDFRRIPTEDICARLSEVAKNEGISLTEDGALLISRIADGALRDALSILDQCAGQGSEITAETVSRCAGLLGKDYLFEISDAVKNSDPSSVLSVTDRLHSSSCDMERLMSELVNHFRNVLMAKTVRKPEDFIVCTPSELEKYISLSKSMTYGTLLYITETLCKEASALKYSAHQRAQVETVLIRLCEPELSTDNASLVRRIDELEAQIKLLKANGASYTENKEPPVKAVEETASHPVTEKADLPVQKHVEQPVELSVTEETQPAPVPEEKTVKAPDTGSNEQTRVDFAVVNEGDKSLPFSAWGNVIKQLGVINKPVAAILNDSKGFRAGNTIFIQAKNKAFESMFNQMFVKDSLEKAIMRATGEKLRPALYNDGTSPEADDGAEPVDVLISKLNKMKIDFILDEE